MAEKIDFLKGLKTSLPTSGATPGTMYFCTDTGEIYLANSSGTPVLMVNKGIASFTTTGTGNAIANLSYDSDTYKLTATKSNFLPLSGGTLSGTINSSGNINLYGTNAYFSLAPSSSGTRCYFQTYNATTSGADDANLKAGFGFGWAQSLIIDKSGNVTIPGDLTVSGGDISGKATSAKTADGVAWTGVTNKPSYYDAKAIKGITRNGTTFTYTCMDGTTGTFTQQDNNTTYNTATTSANGLMSSEDKTKLNGIATGAEVNQNAFSNVTIGSTTIAAESKTDTLTLVAGSNITLTPDATNDKITIVATDTTYSAATQSVAGLMSAADKKKLDGIATGANNYTYTLPNATSSTLGGVKIGSNISVSSGTISLTKANVTSALGYTPPTTNTTYSNATTSTAGLMSPTDKAKLDGIASGATANTGTITAVQANGTNVATSGTANIPAASTSAYGVTKLSSATNSTSTTLAATSSAVKAAYDLANSKAPGYTYGTTDLTAGVSELATGTLYFVYE